MYIYYTNIVTFFFKKKNKRTKHKQNPKRTNSPIKISIEFK